MASVRQLEEAVATVTSKGQVTIPVSVRRRLALEEHDRLLFTISSDGEVTLRPLRYPTLESLAGAAGKLAGPEPADLVATANDERLRRKYGRA